MRWTWGWGVALLIFACSGEHDIGEQCEHSGQTDGECESGGVCGVDTAGVLRCQKICVEQTDCPADQECNGIDGTNLKGCRPKTTTTLPDGGR